MTRRIRVAYAATVLALAGPAALLGTATPAAHAGATITIDDPSSPTAGPVTLTGTVGLGPGEITSVLYAFDATDSTSASPGSDCSGNGMLGPEDDFNDDGSVGDVLDCEIGGVVSLNNSLVTTSGVQAGVVAFANQAAAANVDPVGSATFVAPGLTGGDARPRIETVARSVTRGQIGLYDVKPLGGSGAGTAFNSAVQVILATLGAAPAGPKAAMFLSDGKSAIDDALLDQLATSGIKLRTFGIGAGASCAKIGSLYKMASATGEACTLVQSPADLATGLTGSQPDAINGVTVTIKDVSVAAVTNAVGGWHTTFNLGAGTYTAAAKAVLSSGTTVSSHRTFTVAAGTGGPPPGTVTPGAGSLRATVVKVDRPPASRAKAPPRVTGRVGVPHGRRLVSTRKLSGAKVLLQARAAAGDGWVTVDRDKVDRAGRFSLRWRPRAQLTLLRVALEPHKRFAGSAAAVPTAPLSACKVRSRGTGWTVTCLTTAKDRSVVRLLQRGAVVDRTKVRHGSFRLHGRNGVKASVIDLKAGARHVRLSL